MCYCTRIIVVVAILFGVVPATQAGGTEGVDNTLLGDGAGANVTPDAVSNTFIGVNAGNAVTTEDNNTFVGDQAGVLTTADFNTFIGSRAGDTNSTGSLNTFVGRAAGNMNNTGSGNTYVGQAAGFFNTSGSGNVFLGLQAGQDELGSNRLYIEGSQATNPLIYGEFDNDIVAVNGILGVGTQLPTSPLHVRRSDGTANLLVEEASGTTSARQLYTLENNGPVAFGMLNNDLAQEWRFAAQTSGFRISLGSSGGQEFEVGNDGSLTVGPAGVANLFLDTNGNATFEGTVTANGTLLTSSRDTKHAIEPVDPSTMLERLMALPLAQWSYKGKSERHIGPMAEDFYQEFGLGPDGEHVSLADMAGVAMAAAQALKTQVDVQRKVIEDQAKELRALHAKIKDLEGLKAQVARIESVLPDPVAKADQ